MAVINCRRCGKLIRYEKLAAAPYFPFCSERCKLLDLGQWFGEEHRIPAEPSKAASKNQNSFRPKRP